MSKQYNTKNWTQVGAWASIGFTAIVALGSFVLSFVALYAVGLPLWGRAAVLLPIVIDGGQIVFAISYAVAAAYGEKGRYARAMTALATIGSVAFNVYHITPEFLRRDVLLLDRIIAGTPPAMLFFSIELMVHQIKTITKGAGLVATLQARIAELTTLYKDAAAALDNASGAQKALPEVQAEYRKAQAERERLQVENKALQAQVAAVEWFASLDKGAQAQVLNQATGMQAKEIADITGMALSTASRAIKNLNGAHQ